MSKQSATQTKEIKLLNMEEVDFTNKNEKIKR